MKKLFSVLFLLFSVGLVFAASDPAKQIESARKKLKVAVPSKRAEEKPLMMVHYMPWFKAPPVTPVYGYHWSEGGAVFRPTKTDAEGKANIASHLYPLTGPYDSCDENILEYQISLMKLAGIDGVIINWYGNDDCRDYLDIHIASVKMVEACRKAGMKYALCYEDETINQMVVTQKIAREDTAEQGKKVFEWVQENWFTDDLYVKIDGQPLLLCYGPQLFKEKAQWDVVFSATNPKPFLVTLNDMGGAWSEWTYPWPPMWASTNGVLSLSRMVTYLNEFYSKNKFKKHLVTSAFPGFHDSYKEAGRGFSYGYLDYADGETFKMTLDAAVKSKPDVIQIVTWNDYAEGTIVEPSIEHGYTELEYIQDTKKTLDPSFAFSHSDLRYPLELYRIIAEKNNPDAELARQVVNCLMEGDFQAYKEGLEKLNITESLEVKPILRK